MQPRKKSAFIKTIYPRVKMGLKPQPVDYAFLQALEAGLPPCAGVALGLDRLLMLKFGLTNIDQVLSFR